MNVKPVSYLQTDPRWASWPYSNRDEKTNIGTSGCGPTCMAMVIATWVDPTVNPQVCSEWSLKHGHKATGCGTYHSYFVPQAKVYGLTCERINTVSLVSMDKASAEKCHQIAHDCVDEGHMVICSMARGNWTRGGHFILWYSNDGDNVMINDPVGTAQNRVYAKHSLLKAEVRYYWVVRVPKEVISMTNSEVRELIKTEVAKINESKEGSEPSTWARDAWFSACVAGKFDGTNPKMAATREQLATIMVRNGEVPSLTCPPGFDFKTGLKEAREKYGKKEDS